MKRVFLLPVFLFFAAAAWTQTSLVPLSVGEEWLQMANAIHQSHQVSKEYILHPPQRTLPPSMMDTLARYDWLRTDDFFYKSGEFNINFGEIPRKYFFYRFEADGTRSLLTGGRKFGNDPSLINYHSTHKLTKTRLEQYNGYTFIMMEDGSFMRIVSYENGILLLDVFGETNVIDNVDHPRRFRDVYVAMPRYF